MELEPGKRKQNICKFHRNNSITLGYPDWKRHNYVEVDALGLAVGGVKHTEGHLRQMRLTRSVPRILRARR